jgi:hypothetical protein
MKYLSLDFGRHLIKPAIFLASIIGTMAISQWLIFYARGELVHAMDFLLSVPTLLSMSLPFAVLLFSGKAKLDMQLFFVFLMLSIAQLVGKHPQSLWGASLNQIIGDLSYIAWAMFLAAFWRLGPKPTSL